MSGYPRQTSAIIPNFSLQGVFRGIVEILNDSPDIWKAFDLSVNNFKKEFDAILARGKVDHGQFHDVRRTCLTRWLINGLTEYDVIIWQVILISRRHVALACRFDKTYLSEPGI